MRNFLFVAFFLPLIPYPFEEDAMFNSNKSDVWVYFEFPSWLLSFSTFLLLSFGFSLRHCLVLSISLCGEHKIAWYRYVCTHTFGSRNTEMSNANYIYRFIIFVSVQYKIFETHGVTLRIGISSTASSSSSSFLPSMCVALVCIIWWCAVALPCGILDDFFVVVDCCSSI